jgi:dUTPase
MSIKFSRIGEFDRRFDPSRVTPCSAGIDLFQPEDVTIGPGETAYIDLKVCFWFPPGHYGQLFLRSSSAKLGISLHGGVIGGSSRGGNGMIK